MSKAKNLERALAGYPHRHIKERDASPAFVCAYCHGTNGKLVKVDRYYFHETCPKELLPFSEGEKDAIRNTPTSQQQGLASDKAG